MIQLLLILASLLVNQPAQMVHAQEPQVQARFPVASTTPLGRYVTREWIERQVASSSAVYGLTEALQKHIANTLWLESQGDTQAVGALGEVGLAQIRPEARFHNISQEERFDPYFAVSFIVKAVYEGHSSWWSTW